MKATSFTCRPPGPSNIRASPLTRSDLDGIKAKIDAGAEPWASVHAAMLTYVNPNYVWPGHSRKSIARPT